MRAVLLTSLLVACSCFYSFPVEQKHKCRTSSDCLAEQACLGGQCVAKSRAQCTSGDRRCVDGAAWTCIGDEETGDDCAARGLVCASGVCLKACARSSTDAQAPCGANEACDPNAGACIPQLTCTSQAQCGTGRGCFGGVCVDVPAESITSDDLVSCYLPSPTLVARSLTGSVSDVNNTALWARAELERPPDLPYGFETKADGPQFGTFNESVTIAAGHLSQLRFFGDHGVAPGRHVGPQILDDQLDDLTLLALSVAQRDKLIRSEPPQPADGGTSTIGPPWDMRGRGLLLGQVRGCDRKQLGRATVGYSVPVGRQGYLGSTASPELWRQGSRFTVSGMGQFVAFDVPVGVDLEVVVVVRKQDGSSHEIWHEKVSIDPPAADGYGVTTLNVGRGGH